MTPIESSSGPASIWLRRTSNIFALLIIAYAAWVASHRTFQGFQPFDDEGYMLTSLLNFERNGALYTRTFSQYGPLFSLMQEFMHALLRLPVTHDGDRMLTLFYWLTSAGLATVFLYRITASLILSSVGFLATLMVSAAIIYEPGHPQEQILFLVQAGLCLALISNHRRRRWAGFFLGAIGAALCLIKINVGIFYLAAAYFFYVSRLVSPVRTYLLAAGSLAALALPAVLMHTHLLSWAFPIFLIAEVTILLFGIALAEPSDSAISIAELIFPVAGFLICGVVVIAIALTRQMALGDLAEGVILAPIHHPNIFYTPFLIDRRGAILAAFAACTTASALVLNHYGRRPNPTLLALTKFILGCVLTVSVVTDADLAAPYVLPLVPLLLVGGNRHTNKTLASARLFLCALFVFEFLQIYPVAGTQVRVALTPAIIWALLLVWDGLAELTYSFPNVPARIFPAAVSLVALLLAVRLILKAEHRGFHDRSPLVALDLKGAHRIRVTESKAATYRELVDRIRSNCDVLFTMPGMLSLNQWSGVPTPNGLNMTGWMSAFSKSQQQGIVDVLRSRPRACVVSNAVIVKFWMPHQDRERILAASPLNEFIRDHTAPIFAIELPREPESVIGKSEYELRRVTTSAP